MAKAILELPEMPESCIACPIKRYLHYGWVEHICGITGEQCQEEGRRPDCPLKLEWVNGKCRGYQVSRWDDEPIEKCKQCKDFELYEEVKSK